MGKIKKERNPKSSPDKNKVQGTKKRKSSEKKKGSVEENTRKYGYISSDSVITMAEAAGFTGIQEDVAKNLAEDVTYRLRYIIQQCKKYMIHNKHKKLSSADLNEVLKMCDIPALYGYMADEPLCNFIHVKEADIFILKDNDIDLPLFALSEISVQQKATFVATGFWLKNDEDKAKDEARMKSEVTKHSDVEVNSNNDNLKQGSKNSVQCDTSKPSNENKENETKVPTNLIKYYGVTCNTILGHSDLKMIFQDLSSSVKILPIVPYLLNFITIGLNKLGSERQIKRLLQTIEALSKNSQIDFTPYSATTRVINAMLLIVAIDKKPCKISSDYHLRLYAGRVLSSVLSKWCSRDEQKITIVKKMGKLLNDFNVSPKVHYGAISLLTALGPEALSASLWQTLSQFLEYLEGLRQSSDKKTGSDVAMIEEVLLGATVTLYRNSAILIQDLSFLSLDRCLYSYFGDSICNVWVNVSKYPKCFVTQDSSSFQERKSKNPKVLKYMNSRYTATTKKFSVENVFNLTSLRRKKSTKIIFKFAGAIPVPEVNLKRKRFDSRYSQFIAGKESEGHVVVAGKSWRTRRPQMPFGSLLRVGCVFSIL